MKHNPGSGRITVDALQHCGHRSGHLYCVRKPGHTSWHHLARPGERVPTHLLISDLTITMAGPT